MPPEPARAVNTRRFLVNYSDNHLETVAHLLSPEVTYTVPGRNPLAGTFHGPSEVAQHLSALISFSESTFDVLKWVDWLIGESHVAAIMFAQAQQAGAVYRGHHVFLVETDQDDRLSTIKVFFDQQEAADLFFARPT